MAVERKSILAMLPDAPPVQVVDIGANPIDGEPPYQSLLAAGAARVIGFEPNPEAFAQLERGKGPNETYFPDALGDGREQRLYVCRAPGMTSIYPPNEPLFQFFHGFERWGEVIKTVPVQTRRLDDIDAIEDVDFVTLDVEGYELEILRHGLRKLEDAVIVQTEVNFLPLHVGQPLFADMDLFMREQGFVIHKFGAMHSRVVYPLVVNQSAYSGLSQLIWADAIYLRDFTAFAKLPPAKLLKLAIVLHDAYGSIDMAHHALVSYDSTQGTDLAARYRREIIGATQFAAERRS